MCNRALRRIAGAPRFERDEHALSDFDIRRTLKVPSYDSIMMRGRLRYMGRIIRTRPTTCCLSRAVNHLPLLWEDLHFAWKTVALLASAPPPNLEAPFWIGVMRDKGRWAQVVKSVHFFESALDGRAAAKRTVAATLSKTHECNECHNKFASERASAAHAHRAHGYRTEWSNRVDDSGVCPVCKATFHTRIRVLNHVRSSACRTEVVDLPELSVETIVRGC